MNTANINKFIFGILQLSNSQCVCCCSYFHWQIFLLTPSWCLCLWRYWFYFVLFIYDELETRFPDNPLKSSIQVHIKEDLRKGFFRHAIMNISWQEPECLFNKNWLVNSFICRWYRVFRALWNSFVCCK